jgi:hypothetical protein
MKDMEAKPPFHKKKNIRMHFDTAKSNEIFLMKPFFFAEFHTNLKP